LGSGGKRVTMCECRPSRRSAATISRMKSNRSGWLGVTMFTKIQLNRNDLNPCPFGFGHRRRHSPRVYPTAFRRWMQRSAKPAIGRWRLSLADRLGDEGRQRGTSLSRAFGRGTDIALPAGKGSVRGPARLKQGGEMNSVVAAQGVPLGQVACRSVCPARPQASPSGRDSHLGMRAWAVYASALPSEGEGSPRPPRA
jgi:hypothetical protein